MLFEDYHVHTEFSEDSYCQMQDQITQAIKNGIQEICITDHVDYGVKLDWDEPEKIVFRDDGCPVANVNYPVYFTKLDYMRKLHGDKIIIKNGLEFGMQTHTIGQFQKLFDRYQNRLDFIILSLHQINDQEFWMQAFQKGKTQQQYNEEYYQELYEIMKVYKDYSILGHLDVINRYDLLGCYPFEKTEDIVAEILKLAIKDGKGIEVNTSSFRYGLPDLQPCRKILHLYKDLGGRILTIGSDAHYPNYVGAHIPEVMDILRDEIGFTEICTFDQMVPSFHKL